MIVNKIVFTYKILSVDSIIKEEKINVHINDKIYNKTFEFGGYKLPKTMDFTLWGNTYYGENSNLAVVFKPNSNIIYHINIQEDYTEVQMKANNNIIFEFKDIMNNKGDLFTFTRIIKNQEYNFVNGKLIIKKLIRKVDYIKPINKSLFITENFITMDLETKESNSVLYPICIGIYDGKNKVSFFLNDYNNCEEMLEDSIKYLMRRKYDNYKIYFHNFSYFDGIFLLRILTNLT